jgi:hypothetical protein
VQIRQEDSDMDAIRIMAVRLRLVVAIVAIVGCAVSQAQVKVNVTTWHNDIGRTGQNTNEPTLTTVLVGDKTKFGRICSGSVDGPVYAQPLVVWDATNNRNIVYVATVNDSIYAFNGSDGNCTPLARNTQLIPTTEAAADCTLVGGGNCPVSPTIGILGTSVIDPSSNTIYLVTESQYPKTNPNTWYDRIHALNATTLAERTEYKSPQIISGQVSTGLRRKEPAGNCASSR